MKQTRTILCVALVAAASAASAGDTSLSPRESHVYTATCAHFRDRLATADTRGDGALMTRLSASCDRALDRLGPGTADTAVRDQAAAYLQRLAAFKSTIVTMNMRRLLERRLPVRTVSATGEYLIARRMGLLAAMEPWSDPGDYPVATGD